MSLSAFFLGLALGLLVTAPLAVLAARRSAARVRRLERRARAAERLAETGMLTSGLAHEIKNPLSTVGLNVQLIREDLDELIRDAGEAGPIVVDRLHRTARRVDAMGREVGRLREILEDFLRFAGRLQLDRQPTDLNALLSELMDFYAPQAQASRIHLRGQLDADPAIAPVDAGLLKQAVLNLLLNATQAMLGARDKNKPHGGADELILQTRRRDDEIDIHVIDTGPGIPEEELARVFEPYFSTKRGGTGLGLPTTRRIIEEHGGQVTVHSEPGRGTDVTMALPIESRMGPEARARQLAESGKV